MKRILNVFLLSICILCLTSAVSPAQENPVNQADYQIQPSSVFDITYAVLIWTPVSSLFNPRYVDQFEFKAGDVFSAYTTKHGELTGKWIETEVGLSTWFQAWVEKVETSTTTTTPATTTASVQGTSLGDRISSQALKFDINVWGISFTFVPPAPFDVFGFSTIVGYGAYLGADAFFLGFASVPTTGITCGSVSPSEAEQGSQLSVTIGCQNANFRSAGTISVSIQQGSTNDITVGLPSVKDDNQITVSLDITDNAETSERQITVIVDGVAVPVEQKFTVLKKTTT